MPPQLQALLQNRNALIGIIGLVVVLIVVMVIFNPFGGGGEKDPQAAKLEPGQMQLATVGSVGKALEIQAVLAKQGIQMEQAVEGDKVTLSFLKGATVKDRDIALITLVQSGLMDRNVGLEAFDKSDLTASREEKRIKLFRAQQGELARLIRKIPPIKDASVNITIPEQTLFRSEEKPISAAVQVTMEPGESLSRDKVRAITNLVVGSIQGLNAEHVAISDTNGTTYSSVLDTGAELSQKLEEQDSYMKQKISTQLDKLVGAGRYVVTVSTMLREAPRETMVQTYDPSNTVVSSKQAFNENLNTGGGGLGASGPVSTHLPGALGTLSIPGGGGGGDASKDYLRSGTEVSYENSKTQWIETKPAGMVEDISVAVTIDANHFPSMSVNDLQTLIAHAASPKVMPESVSIARTNLSGPEPISTATHGSGAPQDNSWMWWAGGVVGLCFLMILLLSLKKDNNNDEDFAQAHRELEELRHIASQQQVQLQATQQQTQMLIEAQQRQIQSQPTAPQGIPQLQDTSPLQQTLEELKMAVAEEELEPEDLSLQIKSWIESS